LKHLSDSNPAAANQHRLEEASRQAASDIAWSAMALLGCSEVEVHLLDDATSAYVPAGSTSSGDASQTSQRLAAEDVARALPFGSVLLAVADPSVVAGPLGDALTRLGAASALIVRLDKGRRALGLAICVYAEPRSFSADDQRQVAGFARVSAASLDFARRTSLALDRADRLATLLDSAAAFAGELDLESLFASIHVQIQRLMDAPAFYVAVASTDTGVLQTEYAVDCGQRLHPDSPRQIDGIAAEVFASGKPLVLESSSNPRQGMPTEHETIELRKESALLVPMQLRDRVIGVMCVQSPRRSAYAPEHVELLIEVAEHASTAIQNAGIFREERRRTEELTVLHRLATLTSSEDDLDRVMAAIVAEAAAVFHADAASIALEDESGVFVAVADHGLSEDFRRRRIIDGDALRLLFGDPPADRFFSAERFDAVGQADLLAAEGIASVSLAPLVYRSRLVGCLAFYGRQRSVRLSAGESRLAQLFADQASAALERARAARNLHERVEDEAFLARVGHTLTSRLEVDSAGVLSMLRDHFGYRYLSIFTLEGDSSALVLGASLGYAHNALRLAPHAVSDGIVGAVAQTNEAIYVPDVTADPRYVAGAAEIRSMVAYPLAFGGQVLGVFSIESPIVDGFSSRDRRIISAFADRCAIALSNARQYATATDRLAALDLARAELERHAQHLERRQSELKLINAVSAAVSGTLDLERLLQTAVRSIAKGLRMERVAVGILSDDQSHLEIAVEYRSDGVPVTVGAKLPVRRRSALAEVVFERRIVSADDLQNDPVMRDCRDWINERHLVSGAILPLIVESRVIGTLSVNTTTAARLLTADELGVLETAANQIAVGIRNARLYGRAKERANEDSLTGLFNHRYLQERLDNELARAERGSQPLAIVLFDLNNFKSFNDNFGHQAGDEVLRFVATALTSCLRTTDIAGRYGGDEFLVILPQADEGGARLLLSRLHNKIERRDAGFPPIPIQMSAGIAVYPRDGHDAAELVTQADKGMYADKKRHGSTPAGFTAR
jgi:diguanylate cyclase (GGDEF)-like protein